MVAMFSWVGTRPLARQIASGPADRLSGENQDRYPGRLLGMCEGVVDGADVQVLVLHGLDRLGEHVLGGDPHVLGVAAGLPLAGALQRRLHRGDAGSLAKKMQLASGWARSALSAPERNLSGFHSVGNCTMGVTTPDLSVTACQALARFTALMSFRSSGGSMHLALTIFSFISLMKASAVVLAWS